MDVHCKANTIFLPTVSSLITVFFTLKCHGATRDSDLESINSNSTIIIEFYLFINLHSRYIIYHFDRINNSFLSLVLYSFNVLIPFIQCKVGNGHHSSRKCAWPGFHLATKIWGGSAINEWAYLARQVLGTYL